MYLSNRKYELGETPLTINAKDAVYGSQIDYCQRLPYCREIEPFTIHSTMGMS